MNYSIIRKIVAIILGSFYGYRTWWVLNEGVPTIGFYLVSFLFIMLLFSILCFLVFKEKKTLDGRLVKREVLKDVNWAIVSGALAVILTYFFNSIFK